MARVPIAKFPGGLGFGSGGARLVDLREAQIHFAIASFELLRVGE